MILDRLLNFSRILTRRANVSEDTFLLITAVLVGIGAGVGTVVVRSLIEAVEWVGFELIPKLTTQFGHSYVVVVPAVGGVLVGVLINRYAREAKGSWRAGGDGSNRLARWPHPAGSCICKGSGIRAYHWQRRFRRQRRSDCPDRRIIRIYAWAGPASVR